MPVIFTSLVSGFLLATVAAPAPMVNPSLERGERLSSSPSRCAALTKLYDDVAGSEFVDPESTQLDAPTWF
ncbi:hypothetical protein JB92DRAFT_2900241 [Gautieria morchelliformis]|nr:hypothetical protein JB92DRAFT_2900241 [Gautieria morchelliformis]